MKRADLAEHGQSCPEHVISCHHALNGCPWRGIRSLVSRHLQICSYEPIRGFLSIHDQHMSVLREENLILKNRVEALEGLVQSFQNEMRTVRSTLGPWMLSAENTNDEQTTPRLNTNMEALPTRSVTSPYGRHSTYVPSHTGFRMDSDILSPVSAISTNQDILASYFPPESQQNNAYGATERRRTPTLQIPRPQPSRPTRRPSLSLTTPIESPPFMFPNADNYQYVNAARFGQAPPVPPLVLQGTLEDSLNGLRNLPTE
jgi:hypothetical protein